MKKSILAYLLCSRSHGAIGQDKHQATMEKRANELHRVMGLI
jgi:hypothetical protein